MQARSASDAFLRVDLHDRLRLQSGLSRRFYAVLRALVPFCFEGDLDEAGQDRRPICRSAPRFLASVPQ